ncbi:MAG: hypothetical protein Fur0046_18160 [Cyanobacteria bacterium J069]|nr:MAG: hypothetical protein D6742_04310 [Cyanobacteria bacterium J069]
MLQTSRPISPQEYKRLQPKEVSAKELSQARMQKAQADALAAQRFEQRVFDLSQSFEVENFRHYLKTLQPDERAALLGRLQSEGAA